MRLINSDGQIVDAKVSAAPGASANRNTNTIIDNGKYIATVAICAALCGVSAVYAWAATEKANRSEERADLLQYYLLELDAKVIKAGVKQPEESIAGKLAKEKP